MFGSPLNTPAEQINGHPYKVKEGNECAFPTPSSSPKNDVPVESSEAISTKEPVNKEENGGKKYQQD